MKYFEEEGGWDFTLGNWGRPHWQSGLSKELKEVKTQAMQISGENIPGKKWQGNFYL